MKYFGEEQVGYLSEIFRSIQGEGSHTGRPAIFVRLEGCNLRCEWCDTKYALERRHPVPLGQTLECIEYLSEGRRMLVVITGGEPAMQPEYVRLMVLSLLNAGYDTALETNGTLELGLPPLLRGRTWVCVSPKMDVRGSEVRDDVLEQADEIKFVVGAEGTGNVDEFLASRSDRISSDTALLLQPRSGDPNATQLCYQEVTKRGGRWRLSLQTHKLINVR